MVKSINILFTAFAIAVFISCSEWTDTESIPVESIFPWESEPELWEEYKADLRDYKSHEHTMVYVRFENSPENPVSEKGSLRSLPDSIDIVSLTNADNFSQFDAEDMAWMKSVGTKVLYQLDFAGRMDEFSDEARLNAYIDNVIDAVNSNGLDGYSFTGTPKSGDSQRKEMSRKIVEKLDKARTSGQLIVFEGSHSFIAQEDISKIDHPFKSQDHKRKKGIHHQPIRNGRYMGECQIQENMEGQTFPDRFVYC